MPSVLPRPDGENNRAYLVGLCFAVLISSAAAAELVRVLYPIGEELTALDAGQGSWLRLSVLALILLLCCTTLWLGFAWSRKFGLHFIRARRNRRHTLYILTKLRAISLEPSLEGWHVESYTLDEDMIVSRWTRGTGGDLIFRLRVGEKRGRGWTGLGDVARAEREIVAALARRG